MDALWGEERLGTAGAIPGYSLPDGEAANETGPGRGRRPGRRSGERGHDGGQ